MGGVSDSGGVKLCERTRQECGAGAVAAAVESSREGKSKEGQQAGKRAADTSMHFTLDSHAVPSQ